MAFNPLQQTGVPPEDLLHSRSELNVQPCRKEEVHPYTAMEHELRADLKAYREYPFDGGGCHQAGIAFTLEDLDAVNGPARNARQAGASSYGMAFLFGVPNASARPAMWIRLETVVAVAGDALTDDARRLFGRYISQFFVDIAADHPHLAGSLRTNRPLHSDGTA